MSAAPVHWDHGRLLVLLAVLCAGGCVDPPDDTDTPPDDDDVRCAGASGLRDTATDLCWQDPPAASYMEWPQATEYCDQLELGGVSDWRLPDIDELISLLRGCDDGAVGSSSTTSSCAMVPADCSAADTCVDHVSCAECDYYQGPESDGCYWMRGLTGACTNVYWSASTDGGNGVNPWFANFGNGAVGGHGPPSSVFHARCVH